MIVIKGRFSTYGEIWFDEEPPPRPEVDILMFRSRPTPIEGAEAEVFPSLVNDLTVSEESLMAGLGGTNRYKIRRAETKDGLTNLFVADPHAHLDEFCAFYDTFARQKSLPPSYRNGLKAACEAGRLVLSAASCGGGEPLVWHAHITSSSTAVLLHSASHFRAQDTSDRALLGRANRWLHWRDMLAFRALGIARYDWGGMFEDESVPGQASINNFKREFGGRDVLSYNCILPVTLNGRAYLAVRGSLDRFRPH
jgi:hypothetical protein